MTNLQYALAIKFWAMIRDATKETPKSPEELLAFFLSAELAALEGQRVLKEKTIEKPELKK